MKKILLLCVCMATIANTYAAPPIGIKAGLNLANVSVDVSDEIDKTMRPGFYIGAFTTFDLTEKLALQPEILFSSQGFKYSYDVDNVSMKSNNTLNYLNIPILVKYEIIEGLAVNFGPQFGINLSAKYKDKYESMGETETIKKDFDGIARCDFSLALGLEYMITCKLDVSARYNLGLINLKQHDGIDGQNNVLQIGLGYRIF